MAGSSHNRQTDAALLAASRSGHKRTPRQKAPETYEEKLAQLEELRAASAHNRKMVLTLALSYGGREELVQAAQRIAADVQRGALALDAIDAAALEARLWTHDLPPLELVVRTSGEVRLSNFLLWQVAYAELHLTDTLWPDFGETQLLVALEDFQRRERRFGKTSAQLRKSAT